RALVERQHTGLDRAGVDRRVVVPEGEGAGAAEEQDDARTGGDGRLGELVHGDSFRMVWFAHDARRAGGTSRRRVVFRSAPCAGRLWAGIGFIPRWSNLESSIGRTKGTPPPHCGGYGSAPGTWPNLGVDLG